jgi:hypothetical protein
MNAPVSRFALALLVAALSACAGKSEDSSGGGSDSGLDSGQRVAELNESEIAELCDWTAAQLGGYGVEHECGDGSSARTQDSQQECVDSSRMTFAQQGCALTIAEFEKCVNALEGDVCNVLTEASCLPLISCA